MLEYTDDVDLNEKLEAWEQFYNLNRPHAAHDGKTPDLSSEIEVWALQESNLQPTDYESEGRSSRKKKQGQKRGTRKGR